MIVMVSATNIVKLTAYSDERCCCCEWVGEGGWVLEVVALPTACDMMTVGVFLLFFSAFFCMFDGNLLVYLNGNPLHIRVAWTDILHQCVCA